MHPPAGRLAGVDALKALACSLIVWHHLAFYGPMSDVVHAAAPAVIDWLYSYARMAVQVFLVIGGFLAAATLAPQGVATFDHPGRLIWRRYRRLVLPLLVALLVTTLVAAVVRPWLPHPSVPQPPGLWQVLAHVLLLQDVVGQEALSAGVWYVAIDFQLFVMSTLLFAGARGLGWRAPGLPLGIWAVMLLGAVSLLWFNRRAALDATGLYFFGAYALGMLAWWAVQSRYPLRWLGMMAAIAALALLLDFRGRLLLALLVAALLSGLQRSRWPGRWLQARWLVQLGQMSYSVFLIHFAVGLAVNALVSQLWPTQVLPNALGLIASFGLSLLAGRALYQSVELRSLPKRPQPATDAGNLSEK